MNMGVLIGTILARAIQAWKAYKELNPNDPTLTDDQAIELLRMDSVAGARQADEWLAAHPKAPATPTL